MAMARFSVGQIDEPPSAEGLHGEVAAMVHSGPRLRWNVEMRRRPLTSCVPPGCCGQCPEPDSRRILRLTLLRYLSDAG